MASPEAEILSGLVPDTDSVELHNIVDVAPCPEHGVGGCVECAARIARAREVAESRRKQVNQPSAPATAPPTPQQTAPKAPTEAPLITLAKTYSNLLDQVSREEQLLVGVEARAEFLRTSIAESKTATEAARKNLADFIAAN